MSSVTAIVTYGVCPIRTFYTENVCFSENGYINTELAEF